MKRVIEGELIEAAGSATSELPNGQAGVFETLLLRQGRAEFWAEHWDRFVSGCHAFGFTPPMSCERLETTVAALAEANGIQHGVVRYVAWSVGQNRATWQVDVSPPRPHMAKPAFTVTIGGPVPPTDGHRAFKHLNRQEWTLALREARSRGFDEVLLSDRRGRLVEGAVSNVFVIVEGVVYTPALSEGPLPGIVRAHVLRAAQRLGIPHQETVVEWPLVEAAEEIWLTNALIGLRPVDRVGDRKLRTDSALLTRLQRAGSGGDGSAR